MRLQVRGRYEPGKALVCRKLLKHGGRTYLPGDPFPGKVTTAIAQRRVRQLFDGGWLVYEGAKAELEKPEPKVVTPKVQKAKPKPAPKAEED